MDPALPLDCARLFDFFGRRTPWHRRLWGPSLLRCLDEVAEVATIVRETGRGAEALLAYRRFLVHEVEADLGVAEPQRGQLSQLLKRKSNLSPSDVLQLQHLRAQATAGYVGSWKTVSDTQVVPIERLARSAAATMLDHGYSPSGLHRWLTALTSGNKLSSIDDLLDETSARLRLPSRTWKVLVPVQHVPFRGHPRPGHYLEATDALALLPEALPKRLGVRVNGALVFEVPALDAPAAATAAGALVRRLSARVTVGLPSQDQLIGARLAWVTRFDTEAPGDWHPLRESQRSVEIGTLYRNGLVFTPTDEGANLDEAFELLSSVETGSPGTVLASAWATIESLLCGPTDDGAHVAASRMAAIVTCSLPRAELTPLAHAYSHEATDALAHELAQSHTNLDISLKMERAIRQGAIQWNSPSDQAAAARLLSFISEPATLRRVQMYLEQTFLRLLRLRNRVMHGGSAESAVTSAVVATLPALVGAGVDRIAHGVLSARPRTSPLELAARAEINLQQAIDGVFPVLATLLEPPR